jgi:hypothetical protein
MEDQNPFRLRLIIETQKQGNQTNLKTPKKVSPKTLENFPSMVANFVVGGKYPYRTSTKGLVMHS